MIHFNKEKIMNLYRLWNDQGQYHYLGAFIGQYEGLCREGHLGKVFSGL